MCAGRRIVEPSTCSTRRTPSNGREKRFVVSFGLHYSMATRISWDPGTEEVDFYEVKSAPSVTGTFSLLAIVQDDRTSPNWNTQTARFTYADNDGVDTTIYRVQGFTNGSLSYDSGPLQSEVSQAALLQTRTRVDHNYLYPNAYQYIEPGGAPINEAIVRVFTKPDWDALRRDVALFVTKTNAQGQWVSPFWLEPGMQYVLVFQKDGVCGPDISEITV